MKRGEVPDFSVNQKLGIRSLGAHEQDARRDFQIRQLAFYRGVDSETLETNATVRRYISVFRDADAAGERLGTYGTRQPLQESHPHAYDRVGQAAVLYIAEKMILE